MIGAAVIRAAAMMCVGSNRYSIVRVVSCASLNCALLHCAFLNCALLNCIHAQEAVPAAAWLGRASCGSNTCHGGISGQGPAWNSSLSTWEATDPYHQGAGRLLMNSLSKSIVAGLLVKAEDDVSEQEFDALLEDRCVSCHAPGVLATRPKSDLVQYRGDDDNSARTPGATDSRVALSHRLQAGVDCEACHGAAGSWLDRHTAQDWDSLSPQAQQAGMVATKSWERRTDNCLKCHLGSRSADGLIRDMNHDMVAAGHPALLFDMSRFQYMLPVHWTLATRQQWKTSVPSGGAGALISDVGIQLRELPTIEQHHTGRIHALAAAGQLAVERATADLQGTAVPRPEFAEFRCVDCHHYYDLERFGQASAPLWNRWYTAGTAVDWDAYDIDPLAIRLGQNDTLEVFRKLASLPEQTVGRATTWDIRRELEGELAGRNFAAEHIDLPQVVDWLWYVRLLLMHAQREVAGDYTEALAVLDEFEQRWLNSNAALTHGQWVSRSIALSALVQLQHRVRQVLPPVQANNAVRDSSP